MADHTGHGTLTDEVSDIGELLDLQPPSWHADAACKEHPDLTWFPAHGAPTDAIRAVCDRCAVAGDCLAYAITQGPGLQGWWGGTSQKRRRPLIHSARPAAPARPPGPAPAAPQPAELPLPPGDYRNPAELADYLGVPIAAVYRWRANGIGPPAIRHKGRLHYPADATAQWVAAGGLTRTRTA